MKLCTNLSDDCRKAGMVAALVVNIRLLIPLPVRQFNLQRLLHPFREAFLQENSQRDFSHTTLHSSNVLWWLHVSCPRQMAVSPEHTEHICSAVVPDLPEISEGPSLPGPDVQQGLGRPSFLSCRRKYLFAHSTFWLQNKEIFCR